MYIYIILFFYCYCQAAFAKEIAKNADSKRGRQLLKPEKYAKIMLCSYQSTRELEIKSICGYYIANEEDVQEFRLPLVTASDEDGFLVEFIDSGESVGYLPAL